MQHLQKTWGWVFLPILEKSARSRRRELAFRSSSFLSHSCALFGTTQNSTPLFSMASALFASKHPGAGVQKSICQEEIQINRCRTDSRNCVLGQGVWFPIRRTAQPRARQFAPLAPPILLRATDLRIHAA